MRTLLHLQHLVSVFTCSTLLVFLPVGPRQCVYLQVVVSVFTCSTSLVCLPEALCQCVYLQVLVSVFTCNTSLVCLPVSRHSEFTCRSSLVCSPVGPSQCVYLQVLVSVFLTCRKSVIKEPSSVFKSHLLEQETLTVTSSSLWAPPGGRPPWLWGHPSLNVSRWLKGFRVSGLQGPMFH